MLGLSPTQTMKVVNAPRAPGRTGPDYGGLLSALLSDDNDDDMVTKLIELAKSREAARRAQQLRSQQGEAATMSDTQAADFLAETPAERERVRRLSTATMINRNQSRRQAALRGDWPAEISPEDSELQRTVGARSADESAEQYQERLARTATALATRRKQGAATRGAATASAVSANQAAGKQGWGYIVKPGAQGGFDSRAFRYDWDKQRPRQLDAARGAATAEEARARAQERLRQAAPASERPARSAREKLIEMLAAAMVGA